MTENISISPNLPDWIQDHMRRYIETDGEDGHIWNGVPTLLLTTIGRKSGKPQSIPLIYGRDGDNYLIVASKGGHPDHPSWYLNLDANSDVKLQVGAEKFSARARTANTDERPSLWKIMEQIFPTYNDYKAKAEREIPVVVLERV